MLYLQAFFRVFKAQADVGIKPNFAGGEVVSLTDSKIVLNTKDGTIEVVIIRSNFIKTVSPENPSLKTAVDANFSDIGVGDKLLVTGMVSEDKKTIPAKVVYLMTKADIAQKQAKRKRRMENTRNYRQSCFGKSSELKKL